ncbi:MAG TPA: PAS domain-containing protein, partial [Acidimicrobiales bacterium]|nr:PAS domain-containing protein [Acidimicrobiales bacterium]
MSQSTRGSRTTSGWGRPEAGHTALDDMAMLEQLLDSLDQGVMVVDLTGEIVYWNTATDLLFSWPEAEALARSALHLWREAEGRPRKAVAHGRAFDGVMTVSPVTDHRGETFAVAAVVGDLPGLQDRLTQARR